MNDRYERIIAAYESALAGRDGGEVCSIDMLLAILDKVRDATPEEIFDALLLN